jgi:hypothetical protein
LISDDEIERCVSYLRDSAREAAQARAEREYLDKFMKSKLAMLASGLNEGSEALRDREARKHPEYLKVLDGYKEAVRRDEEMRFLRDAAHAKIEAWRTFSSNTRGKL